MKWVLLIFIVVCFSYIGYGFSKYYSRRNKFFEDLILFSERLCIDIAFSKDKMLSIVNACKLEVSKDLERVLLVYEKYLVGEIEDFTEEMYFETSNLLNEDEQSSIKLFFKNLGRLDSKNQTKEIENFKTKFELLRKNSDIENRKFGGLFIKLGFILGLTLAILLI